MHKWVGKWMLCQEKDQLHDAFSSNEGAYLT